MAQLGRIAERWSRAIAAVRLHALRVWLVVKGVTVDDFRDRAGGHIDVLIELELRDLPDSLEALVRWYIFLQQLLMCRQAGRSETAADTGIDEPRVVLSSGGGIPWPDC
ncbi:hypothetical protein [Pseudomonas glycinae]|uniref:Uncharacterized protein n=1 Tax=Pseudomonas glycinae TaxID=1785145 RepID=A0ABN5FX20_9PSED|nr:hypothetical protein [Pseudomonas glycinae]AUG97618.1 hypothetical protein AWU82_29850 [Pseudomonas glycinae]